MDAERFSRSRYRSRPSPTNHSAAFVGEPQLITDPLSLQSIRELCLIEGQLLARGNSQVAFILMGDDAEHQLSSTKQAGVFAPGAIRRDVRQKTVWEALEQHRRGHVIQFPENGHFRPVTSFLSLGN